MALQKPRKRRYAPKNEPDLAEKDKEARRKWALMEMIPSNDRYSALERYDALVAYATTGSLQEAVKLTKIPYQTLVKWRREADWWKNALIEIRLELDDKLDGRLTRVANTALDHMMDRLENGDAKLDKNGEIVRVPVPFKDLAVAGLGIVLDKRALGRGQPTSRVDHTNENDRIKKLKEMFDNIQQPKIIQGETIKDDAE